MILHLDIHSYPSSLKSCIGNIFVCSVFLQCLKISDVITCAKTTRKKLIIKILNVFLRKILLHWHLF